MKNQMTAASSLFPRLPRLMHCRPSVTPVSWRVMSPHYDPAVLELAEAAWPLELAAGAGATAPLVGVVVRVLGLDEDYRLITEDVALNDQTPVATVASFFRVLDMKVMDYNGLVVDADLTAAWQDGNLTWTLGLADQPELVVMTYGNTTRRPDISRLTVPANCALVVSNLRGLTDPAIGAVDTVVFRGRKPGEGGWREIARYVGVGAMPFVVDGPVATVGPKWELEVVQANPAGSSAQFTMDLCWRWAAADNTPETGVGVPYDPDGIITED